MVTLICCICFILPLLFGTFTARRFNFIHGAIVTFAWYTIMAGVYFIFANYAGTTEWMVNAAEWMEKYCHYAYALPLQVSTVVMRHESMQNVEFIAQNETIIQCVCLFVIPFIIWLVSRLISGAVRNRRGY